MTTTTHPGKTCALNQAIRPTVLIDPVALSARLDVQVTVAVETFQHTGSFKFRAAYNVASRIPQSAVITASSGNFGQAMAYACQLLKKRCTVVMPSTSARVKVDAVRGYGAEVELLDVKVKSRAKRVEELAAANPDAYIASPFDDPLVIEGNASLGAELVTANRKWDSIVVPIGGGGLISGVVTGLRRAGNNTQVLGAEPAMANDAARSLRAGHLIANDAEPLTLADGARTVSLGRHTWEIIKQHIPDIVEVSEVNITAALRRLFIFANLKVEPTGALSLGAVLEQPQRFKGRSVCCIVSGGNVDPQVYCEVLGDGS